MEDEYHVPGYGLLAKTLRRWWANCAQKPDDDIAAIDELEDAIKPLDDQTIHIRQLIGCFESCHHKAERHADIIIEAIGAGFTEKAKGRRDPERMTSREREYKVLIEVLTSWCSGSPVDIGLSVGAYTGREIQSVLGDPAPLKVWQVQMVIEKIRRFLDTQKRWDEAYENVVDTQHTGENAEFRDVTKQIIIQDTADDRPAEITLASAIDFITGCNWDFVETIRTVLMAIGGRLYAERPLALHARNIKLNPACRRMRTICNTLKEFCESEESATEIDPDILRILGSRTPVKRWLAASMDKTIRLQLSI